MSPLRSEEVAPAGEAGATPAVASGPTAPAGGTGCADRALTAVDVARPRPVAETEEPAAGETPARPAPAAGRRRGAGGGRAVLAAAVAGAALAAGIVTLVAPGNPGGPRTVEIRAVHSRFEPDRITVEPGSTVRFVIHNVDPIDHEFIIGPPEIHDIHERGEPHVHTGAVRGEITVPAGATVETTWTFPPSGGSPEPGTPEVPPGAVAYGCHLAGHWDYGMHGLALVR